MGFGRMTIATVRMMVTVLAVAALPQPISSQESQPVVGIEWLAEHLEDEGLVILQVGPEEGYQAEHVPGARLVQLDDLTAPMQDDGDHANHLVLELPAPDALRSALQGYGISDDSRIAVISTARAATQAARVVFTLDAAGLGERTSWVDGGLEAWKAADHPVTAAVSPVVPGRLTLLPSDRVVSQEWILAGNGTQQGFSLLDARVLAFYEGERADRGKEGHIAGARSMPGPELLEEDEETGALRLKGVEELRSLFRAAGVGDTDTVVAYCHIGQYATVVLLAARRLGHDVLLYDGSMNEWALDDLPVERGPGN